MSDLAGADELGLLLGLTEAETETQEDTLEALLDQATAIFTDATHRWDIPFRAAQTNRVELIEGISTRRLWLDYPVASVSEIVLGPNVADPLETLDPSDPTVVVIQVGKRDLIRMDGGTWRTRWAVGDISFVRVTYTTQADLPADAALAVLNLAATLYRGIGAETVRSESLDNYAVTYASRAESLAAVPGWTEAAKRHRRMTAIL